MSTLPPPTPGAPASPTGVPGTPAPPEPLAHRLARRVERAAVLWALAGGVLLAAVVLVNLLAVTLPWLGLAFPGDFELTEMGVAVAAFTFLPLCQLHGANVTADIFTARAGPRFVATMEAIASLLALGLALLLLWRMSLGMIDRHIYREVTAILQLPLWGAYVPILASLALLAAAAVVTLLRALAAGRRRAEAPRPSSVHHG